MSSCEHGRRKSRCVECGGSAICEHKKIKIQCIECGGSQTCQHKKQRSGCKDCGGGSICVHGIRRVWCFRCLPLSFAKNRLLLFNTQAKRRGYAIPKISAENLLFLMKTSRLCVGCGGALNWKAKRTPHLHHDHNTGYVFGFCHPSCNHAEGMISKLTLAQRLCFFKNFFPETCDKLINGALEK